MNEEIIIRVGDVFLVDDKNQVEIRWVSDDKTAVSFGSINGYWNGWLSVERFLKRATRIDR